MYLYGITEDFTVKIVALGSKEMMACIEVATSKKQAERRAAELLEELKRSIK